MKKSLTLYSIVWVLCFAFFNIVVFITPDRLLKYTGSFFVGYASISIAFFIQLGCGIYALANKEKSRTLFSLPLISISYVGLIFTTIFGTILMVLSFIPKWIAIIIMLFIFGLNAIAIFKAGFAVEMVDEIDKKIKVETRFINEVTIDAKILMNTAHTEDLKKISENVYEAFRYSDPISNESLKELDYKIKNQFGFFKDAVRANDLELARSISDLLIESVNERNEKIKMYK